VMKNNTQVCVVCKNIRSIGMMRIYHENMLARCYVPHRILSMIERMLDMVVYIGGLPLVDDVCMCVREKLVLELQSDEEFEKFAEVVGVMSSIYNGRILFDKYYQYTVLNNIIIKFKNMKGSLLECIMKTINVMHVLILKLLMGNCEYVLYGDKTEYYCDSVVAVTFFNEKYKCVKVVVSGDVIDVVCDARPIFSVRKDVGVFIKQLDTFGNYGSVIESISPYDSLFLLETIMMM